MRKILASIFVLAFLLSSASVAEARGPHPSCFPEDPGIGFC